MTPHDRSRKKKARERRLKQKATRKRTWAGKRSNDFAVLRKLIELERGLEALRGMLGPGRNETTLIFFAKGHGEKRGEGRTYRNPEKGTTRKQRNLKKRPKGMSKIEWQLIKHVGADWTKYFDAKTVKAILENAA